ncbi:MAG: hypothetical protein HY920_03460 [Elusimicrobia bacterium]|nr:hypothetical protein [Elusimicrobiota bacterium]
MRKKWLLAGLFCLMAVGLAGAEELTEYLPKNTELVYSLRNIDTSSAWQSLIKNYQGKVAGTKDDPDYFLLDYLFRQFKFKQIAGGSFVTGTTKKNILVVYPDLEGEKERFNKFLIDNLGNFVSVNPNWQNKQVNQQSIFFDSWAETNDLLTAFSVQGSQVVLASNSGLVATCLETKTKQNSMVTAALFKELSGKIPPDYDGLIFVNNQSRKFSQDLKKWETDNKMVVLMSGQWLEAWLLEFKLLTADSLQGKIVFKCSDQSKLNMVKNDAQFLGEVVKRKYAYSQLVYKNKVAVEGNSVILDFAASNFKAILEKEL